MDTKITIAQAVGLRRVAADLDRTWGTYMEGKTQGDNELFPGEEFVGCMLAAPILRAFAAEMALKAIAIKTAGARMRRKRPTRGRHNLLELFDALDQSTRDCIDQQARQYDAYRTHGSVRSVLASHKDDFNDFRFLGESWRGKNPYGDDLDVALCALIAAFHELPEARSAPSHPGRNSN